MSPSPERRDAFFLDRDGKILHLETGGPMKDETIAPGIAKASSSAP